ncbi:MAG: SMC-Scp complex subunit ScpB [Candidatus Paceibacterota bacterium]|jgi:segregation and condensation protein B
MNIGSIIESMLFISGEPMSFKKLSKYTSIEVADLENAAVDLAKKYNEEARGLRILIKDKEVQMVTAGENSKYVENYMKADIEGELSRAALEVLSVVAYRGPIPRSKIEEIRGVNCSFTLRHLLIRGLVERIDNPSDARTYLYRISFDFLKKLGVEKAEHLPRFEELRNKKILEERFVENAEAKEEGAVPQKEADASGQKQDIVQEAGASPEQTVIDASRSGISDLPSDLNTKTPDSGPSQDQSNNNSQ